MTTIGDGLSTGLRTLVQGFYAGSRHPNRQQLAVYPGSFDPVTLGHMDVAHRAAANVDCLILAVGRNPGKNCLFSVPERVAMLRDAFAQTPNIEVDAFEGWLALYARKRGAQSLVRGVRGMGDWLSEAVMAGVNFCLGLGLRTKFVVASPNHVGTSSSLARRLAQQGRPLNNIVSPSIEMALRRRNAEKAPAFLIKQKSGGSGLIVNEA